MKKIIDNIEIKLEKLILVYNNIKIDKLNLQKNNDVLNARLQNQEKEIVALQDRIKLMNISKSVDVNSEDRKATRLKINEYVREIDRCIALLNK
ncbi:MAG: hypothetical protein CMD08_00245 [Flavobacteriales bacterium]|nr:hypothetical protein [Flavobacteriales bacterium]